MGLFDFVSDALSEVIVQAIELPKNIVECVTDTIDKVQEKIED